jgi:membrane fusion protein (multidrug efflux system)
MKLRLTQIACILLAVLALSLPACHPVHAGEKEQEHAEHHEKIVATRPMVKDVTITQKYVCQIRSQRNIEIRALEGGYLEEIQVKEGQAVKRGDVLFKVMPTLYKAKLDAELAEVNVAEIEYRNAKKLSDDKVISEQDSLSKLAKLTKARAQAKLAEAEVAFTEVKAPFDGIIDRLQQQHGSLIKEGKEGDVLTTLSDNSTMWVYFNVPEARYLDDMATRRKAVGGTRIEVADKGVELVLANGGKFTQDAGQIVTVEGQCDLETGNFKYRADFPNPEGLLRNGQTGNVLIHRVLKDAIVIPQRATFEVLDKRYVYVIGEDHAVHQREIQIEKEMDDIFVIKKGLGPHDEILLDGVQQVREGQHVTFDTVSPEKALANLKFHAE